MTDIVPTWVDGPGGGTPLNAANLNLGSTAIRNLQQRLLVLAATDPVPTGLLDGTIILRKRAPYFVENWTATNGSAWPAGWTSEANGGTIDIQSNSGRIVTPATAYTTSRTYHASVASGDVTYQMTLASTAEQYHFLYFRDDAAGNYYRCTITPTDIGFQKAVSGSVSYITTSSTISLSASTAYAVRVDWTGSTFSAKIWAASGSEPAGWTATASDSTYTAAGSFGLGVSSGAASTAITAVYDNLVVQDISP